MPLSDNSFSQYIITATTTMSLLDSPLSLYSIPVAWFLAHVPHYVKVYPKTCGFTLAHGLHSQGLWLIGAKKYSK